MDSAESRQFAGYSDDDAATRRRVAIKLFLSSPLLAVKEFPDLINELREFFLHSSNPHEDQTTGEARHNSEELFEQWLNAKSWSNSDNTKMI